ncbi:hypothetical protein [Parasphingorhabdus sp.]|uniref:hypothetical protein n=1 Tax=Parasphingorhabdus sp. TaxID=2709688 RepID=UPI003266E4F3
MTKKLSPKQRIVERLASYWKMEAGTAVMIPVVMFYLSEGQLGPASYATMVPMIMLLVIGASYWRSKYLQLTKPRHDPLPLLKTIRRLRPFALALTIAALVYTIMLWIKPDLSAGLNDRITATVASTLALAEYINYYHRQLQHFDNLADFKRLLTGKGFRRSQMAVDLDGL